MFLAPSATFVASPPLTTRLSFLEQQRTVAADAELARCYSGALTVFCCRYLWSGPSRGQVTLTYLRSIQIPLYSAPASTEVAPTAETLSQSNQFDSI